MNSKNSASKPLEISDLRGFLGIDSSEKPGYDSLRYTVRIKGNASEEQFRKVHEIVKATSPNRFNVAGAIALSSQMVVEKLNQKAGCRKSTGLSPEP